MGQSASISSMPSIVSQPIDPFDLSEKDQSESYRTDSDQSESEQSTKNNEQQEMCHSSAQSHEVGEVHGKKETEYQTSYPLRYKYENIDQYLKSIEPDLSQLIQDLKHLALYFAKIGPDVKLVKESCPSRVELSNCPEFSVQKIETLVNKYDLIWHSGRDKSEMNAESNKTLYHVALSYPRIFITAAGRACPGALDERRFWYCANNADFWAKYSNHFLPRVTTSAIATRKVRSVSSALLSDVLDVLLTTEEPKLITVCALRATVKQQGFPIHINTYSWFRGQILQNIRGDEWGKSNVETKDCLRRQHKIAEMEAELALIKINAFIYWWNLTSLRQADAEPA